MADMELSLTNPGIQILQCVRMRLPESWWTYPNLSAPHWRFYWNPLPGGGVSLNGRVTPLDPTICAVIPPHTPFASSNKRLSEQFYFHFVADPPFERVTPAIYTFPVTREIRQVLDEASTLLRDRGRKDSARFPVLLHWLACLALMQVPDDQLRPMRLDPRIQKAIKRMQQNVGGTLPNPQLAEEAGMNTNAFIRLFKRHMGQTPQTYLLRKRLDHACQLLCFTSQTVKAIAEKTGFCDRYHFSRVFRKHQDVGPATYRNMHMALSSQV